MTCLFCNYLTSSVTHTYTHTLTLTHTHTYKTQTNTHKHTYALTHSLSPTPTPTLTHTFLPPHSPPTHLPPPALSSFPYLALTPPLSLSLSLSPSHAHTNTFSIFPIPALSSFPYLALTPPEIILGGRASPSSSVWTAGAVACHILCGKSLIKVSYITILQFIYVLLNQFIN